MSACVGPNAWINDDDCSIEVEIRCRRCGWQAVAMNVSESEVHKKMAHAKRMYDHHKCWALS